MCEVLQQGCTDVDVHRMREAHRARTKKELGEAYRIRFSTPPLAKPPRPDLVDVVGPRVVGRAERALAAAARGVAYVPVHLTSDETTRRALTPQREHEVGQIAPGVVDLRRMYDSRFRGMREGTQAPKIGRRNGERHATCNCARPARPMRLEREG
jgi:hypothetical protein